MLIYKKESNVNYKLNKRISLAVLGLLALLLSSCGGSDPTTTPAPGVVGATYSPSEVKATIGLSQPVVITFQTSSGQATGLNVPLANLPIYWQSAPTATGNLTNYTCDNQPVTSDSGCKLVLTYAPKEAQANKSFELPYTYINSQGTKASGEVKINYSAESGNVVVAIVNPNGLINPSIGSSKPVSVTFNTNTKSATKLSVTNLSSLPSSWTVNPANTGFSCDSVSATGNGCQLNLTYRPTAAESGSIDLNYTYLNDNNVSQSAKATLLYNVTKGNNVVATYPATVRAKFDSTRDVKFSFTTDDNGSATNLSLDLSKLATSNPGWTSAESSYLCNTVDGANCPALTLTYAPKTTDKTSQGYLILPYSYVDKAAESKTGAINLWYQATANDVPANVLVTSDPDGSIYSTLGATKQVSVNFSSATKATNLQITSGLDTISNINPGWSTSNPKFSCATVDDTNLCKLLLFFTPTDLNQYGSVVLKYSYTDSNSQVQTGTYSISYQVQKANKVKLILESSSLDAIVGGTTTLNYSLITDDARPASNLALTITGYKGIPATNLKNETLNCPIVNDSSSICTKTLSYSPTAAESGSLVIGYSYLNNAHESVTQQQTISYSAVTSSKVKPEVVTPDGAPITMALPVEASQGESTSLALHFTTYDGSAATDFKLDTSKLPTSWALESGAPECASVESDATKCSMILSYKPTTLESGQFDLSYSYTDSANVDQTGSLSIYYRSMPAWTRVARYDMTLADQTTTGDNRDPFGRTNTSAMVMDQDGLPMFLVTLGSLWTSQQHLGTFKLTKDNNLVEADFESNITEYSPYLVRDNQGDLYRAYNINGYDGQKVNLVVQKLEGESWIYLGESSGVFQLPLSVSDGRARQHLYPALAVDSHNNLYLNASGYLNVASILSVLQYDTSTNSWNSVGSFNPVTLISFISSLAIDHNDSLYAFYGQYSKTGLLYKYNGSFWQNIPVPDIHITDSKGSLFFDSHNNLYLAGTDLSTGNPTLLEYNGLSWLPVGNQDVFYPRNGIRYPMYQAVIDQEDNLYLAVNNGYLSVYKYNRATNHWDSVGARSFTQALPLALSTYYTNSVSIGLSPDSSTVYVTALTNEDGKDDGTGKFHMDLYSYKVK